MLKLDPESGEADGGLSIVPFLERLIRPKPNLGLSSFLLTNILTAVSFGRNNITPLSIIPINETLNPKPRRGSEIASDAVQLSDFPPDSEERTCTEAELVKHITEGHFMPLVLDSYGVPRFDIELAKLRGFSLQAVVEAAYQVLASGYSNEGKFSTTHEGSEKILSASFSSHNIEYLTEQQKGTIVKTLMLIEDLGVGRVDWRRVTKLVPSAPFVNLDLERDAPHGGLSWANSFNNNTLFNIIFQTIYNKDL